MKKIFTTILLIVIFFVIYFLQVNFFNWFTIAGVKPNLFVIYLIIIGIFAGNKIGGFFGILMGLYIDIINGKYIGISSIALCLIGFLSEYIYKNVSNDNKITIMLIIAVNTAFYELLYYFGSILKLSSPIEILSFSKIIAIEIFFNIILTIIFYQLIQKFGNLLKYTFKNKDFFKKTFVV